jgi:dipicolinate synthase subunit A
LAVLNAVATAEGAIQLAMEETAITICRAKVLVIGFGRIGKILAHRLKGLGAHVTVAARSYADFAWIRAYGYENANTLSLEGTLGRYDIVINTVPARVLGEERLRELSKDCLCMDLASKPGGMDFAAASKLGIKAIWALSLPGEVAPITSGSIIKEAIYNIIAEQEAQK